MLNSHYTAFISYRHTKPDEEIAKRLHTLIETYRIPGELKRRRGRKRMGRVFRDQEELPLSNNLGADIRTALDCSDWLIVICSPRYLESRWCNAELDHFLASGRRDHVLTVLVEGEPDQAFPPQLRFLREEGRVIEIEPLAADVRAETLSGALARLREEKLRILAPMLGVPYDQLRRRERGRRIRAAAGAAAVVFGVLAGFLGYALVKNRQIAAQRDLAVDNQMKLLIQQSNISSEAGDKLIARRQLNEAAALRESVGQGNDGELRSALEYALYNDSFGKVLTIDNDNRSFSSLVFSNGGAYLLGITNLNSACLIDAGTGELLFTVSRSDIGELSSVGFTRDDRYFYMVDSWYGFVSLYDVTTGALFKQYDASNDTAWNIAERAFPLEGDRMLIVRRETLVTWDYAQDQATETLPCGDGPFESYTQPLLVELAPEGQRVAIGSHGYGLGMRVVGLDGTGEVPLEFDAQRGYYNLTFSGDGRYLAATSARKVFVWNTETGEQVFAGEPGDVESVLLSQDGSLLAAAGSSFLGVFSVPEGRELWAVRQETNVVTEIHLSADGKYLSAYGTICGVYDARTGEQLCRERAGAFHGDLVIVGSYDSEPALHVTPAGDAPRWVEEAPAQDSLWSVARYTEPKEPLNLELRHNCSEYYSTGAGSANRRAALYTSPDLDYAAYTHYDGFIEVFDISDPGRGEPLYCVAEHCFAAVTDLTFHGDLMASCGGYDPRCTIFDLRKGKILHVLCGTEYVHGCEFSKDGSKIILLCGYSRDTAIVFSTQTGNRLFALQVPAGRRFSQVAFTADGAQAAAILEDGGAMIAPLYPTLESLIAATEQ